MSRYELVIGPNISYFRTTDTLNPYAGKDYKVGSYENRFELLDFLWIKEEESHLKRAEFIWRDFQESDFQQLLNRKVPHFKAAIELYGEFARMYLVRLGEYE